MPVAVIPPRRPHFPTHFLIVILFTLLPTACSNGGWIKTETEHLILHYKPGTFAERDLAAAKREYEESYQALTQILPQIQLPSKIKVYLHEDLDKMGYTRAALREVHFQYNANFRLTSMHEFMHIFLHELNPRAPLRFEEGVCRMDEVRGRNVEGAYQRVTLVQLAKRVPEAQRTLEQVFADRYDTDSEGNLAAAFARFTWRVHGPERFWDFYSQLDRQNWKLTLRQLWNRDLPDIEMAFKNFVAGLPDIPQSYRPQ